MTIPPIDSASFWDSLLDRLESFLEAEQNAPDELAHGLHVVLGDGTWATVRLDQVEAAVPEDA